MAVASRIGACIAAGLLRTRPGASHARDGDGDEGSNDWPLASTKALVGLGCEMGLSEAACHSFGMSSVGQERSLEWI
jgi:hypothetical protein